MLSTRCAHAGRFRYSNSNGLTHFDRYLKLQRDVTTTIYNAESQIYSTGAGPGQRWWAKHRRAEAPSFRDFLT